MSLKNILNSVTEKLERIVNRTERISEQLRFCTRVFTIPVTESGEILTISKSTGNKSEFDDDFVDAKFSEWIDAVKKKVKVSGQNLPPDEVWIARIEKNARKLYGAKWKYELVKRILKQKKEWMA